MGNKTVSEIRNLSQWLLLQETVEGKLSEKDISAAFRVCGKLHRILLTLAGDAGSRSLLSRSLSLAKAEVSWLDSVQIKDDGSIEWDSAVEPEQDKDVAARGGTALVSHLLGLIVTFIGEPLMLRLVRDIWPDAPYEAGDFGKEKRG